MVLKLVLSSSGLAVRIRICMYRSKRDFAFSDAAQNEGGYQTVIYIYIYIYTVALAIMNNEQFLYGFSVPS
ncbi:MAG: hypothetical protein ACKPKO_45775 [Candidatus Fonsibacter sp.]